MTTETVLETDDILQRIYKTVNQLSQSHEEKVWSGMTLVSLDRDPLLQSLREALYGDLGQTESGRSAAQNERSLLDLTAFELYEDITGRIEAYHRYLTNEPKRDTPEETLRAWYIAFDNNYRAGKYTDLQMLRTYKQLAGYAFRIRNHFDRPREKQLKGECPVETCGLTFVKDKTGTHQTALYASYKRGEQPFVKCRNCGAVWEGERTLLELGYYLGATVDHEALREMGVAV